MRTSSLYEQGFINADVKKKRDMEIYNKLRRLTIENQERISARGNTARSTDFANNQIITRFLEGKFHNVSKIISLENLIQHVPLLWFGQEQFYIFIEEVAL